MYYISEFGQNVGLQHGCSLQHCILLSVGCPGRAITANNSQIIFSGRFISL